MVKLSCGYKCLQILLVIWNAIILVCGIALLVLGSLAIANLNKYASEEDAPVRAFLIFVIALGCFMFVLGLFGFCGACKKNTCCLMLYIIFVAIFLLAGIGGGIAGFILKDKVLEYATKVLNSAYKRYDQDEHTKKFIDKIQQDLKCCGTNGTWTETEQAPASCKDPTTNELYTTGCIEAANASVKKYILIIALCVFFFALLQVLGLIFGICVYQALKRGEDA